MSESIDAATARNTANNTARNTEIEGNGDITPVDASVATPTTKNIPSVTLTPAAKTNTDRKNKGKKKLTTTGHTDSQPQKEEENNNDDDDDDASSIDSSISSLSDLDEELSEQPEAYDGGDDEEKLQNKELDSNKLDKIISHNAIKGNVETKESLAKSGLNLNKAELDPLQETLSHGSNNEIFPEEYQLETKTGLVKMKTIEGLNRVTTSTTPQSSINTDIDGLMYDNDLGDEDQISIKQESHIPKGINEEQIEKVVERNKKEIEKYQEQKHHHGFRKFLDSFMP
ncbi:uncharacterized protein SCDLUD_002383 [Saccharomycodes ludwigii]|uniref:uncharacterized protein n=1 Tax=Saccharomycodes ludwigii TaxID=36035 RepID=UPI001E885C3C|nr:hypothetical protein SCDLUD_002383 [Saccharomycodes ludwigii]KAH3900923.1 hypothetical protein SCDLUD_002383 [Saccharomycodes ludwigii]